MTTILFTKASDGTYLGFTCMGHAEFAKKHLLYTEPDILCSAISALTYSTANVLSDLIGEELDLVINENDGFFRCFFKNPPQPKSQFMMDALVFSMQNLSEDYGEQFLQIQFEEV